MQDRELLELAARAADEGIVFYGGCLRAQTGREWNPLADDGDAFRLAVKLRIDVGFHDTNGHVRAHPRHREILFTAEDYHAHPTIEAAARRAIVRAAAASGAQP